jgi:hypothetical protein
MESITAEMKRCRSQMLMKLFWQQQLQANQLKDHRQVRWHPTMIRWRLNLKLKSSGVRGVLRSSGVFVLPSERTLRDYTHWIKADSGFVMHT